MVLLRQQSSKGPGEWLAEKLVELVLNLASRAATTAVMQWAGHGFFKTGKEKNSAKLGGLPDVGQMRGNKCRLVVKGAFA
jgi:hypothetical protein